MRGARQQACKDKLQALVAPNGAGLDEVIAYWADLFGDCCRLWVLVETEPCRARGDWSTDRERCATQ